MSFNPALLNQNSVKKFVDRLEKIYTERFANTPIKRTQMYEDVAHFFGYDSWHNMDQAMKNARSPVSQSENRNLNLASAPQSAVLHLLQNTQLPLTDAVVQNQIMGILRAQSIDDMLQSCREMSRFITHNHNDNSDLLMEIGQKIRSDCPDHFHEAREEVIKILSGRELQDFLIKTHAQEEKEEVKRTDKDLEAEAEEEVEIRRTDKDWEEEKIQRTDKYLSGARIVMKRLDYTPQPFVSQRSTWTFEPLVPDRLTSFEQIDEVLEKLKGEFKTMPERLKNAPNDVKSGVHQEIMEYVYGEHGVLYRAHSRYPEEAQYNKTSDALDKALGITPNVRLKHRPR